MRLRPVIIDTLKSAGSSMRWFYLIYCAVMVLVAVLVGRGASATGMEMASIIFLIVFGASSFKNNFTLYVSSGLSRKTFLLGTVCSFPVVALFMATLDTAINRFFNLFYTSVSNYEMIYGGLRGMGGLSNLAVDPYRPPMDMGSIFGAILWQFCAYLFAVTIALFVAALLYRLNMIGKLMVAAVPVLFFIVVGSTFSVWGDFWAKIFTAINHALFDNAAICGMWFLLLTAGLFLILALIIRNLAVKRR